MQDRGETTVSRLQKARFKMGSMTPPTYRRHRLASSYCLTRRANIRPSSCRQEMSRDLWRSFFGLKIISAIANMLSLDYSLLSFPYHDLGLQEERAL
jgi:hypothetical protein